MIWKQQQNKTKETHRNSLLFRWEIHEGKQQELTGEIFLFLTTPKNSCWYRNDLFLEENRVMRRTSDGFGGVVVEPADGGFQNITSEILPETLSSILANNRTIHEHTICHILLCSVFLTEGHFLAMHAHASVFFGIRNKFLFFPIRFRLLNRIFLSHSPPLTPAPLPRRYFLSNHYISSLSTGLGISHVLIKLLWGPSWFHLASLFCCSIFPMTSPGSFFKLLDPIRWSRGEQYLLFVWDACLGEIIYFCIWNISQKNRPFGNMLFMDCSLPVSSLSTPWILFGNQKQWECFLRPEVLPFLSMFSLEGFLGAISSPHDQ